MVLMDPKETQAFQDHQVNVVYLETQEETAHQDLTGTLVSQVIYVVEQTLCLFDHCKEKVQ